MTRIYQDADFEVAEIAGHVPIEFLALGEAADEMVPETLLVCIGRDRWHRCFLDAFLGFWEVYSEAQIAQVFDDYDGVPRVDLLARFSLTGKRILRAACQRTASEGTRLSIVFESGSVLLREIDPLDPDSASALEFHPA